VIPYFLFIGRPDAFSSSGAIGAMIFLSHALSVLSSLVLAAGLVLLFIAAQRDQTLGAWRTLLLAIAIAAVLSSTAPFALAAAGLTGDMMLSEVSEFVMGLLWVALGVALWRHAPQNQNLGTTPLIS
jgi:ABC-type enterobactin transport system permease subunit